MTKTTVWVCKHKDETYSLTRSVPKKIEDDALYRVISVEDYYLTQRYSRAVVSSTALFNLAQELWNGATNGEHDYVELNNLAPEDSTEQSSCRIS